MTHIWVPKAKILETELFNRGGIGECEYTLKKYKADTNQLVQEVGPFSNLITNQGLNRWGTAGFGSYTFVGTGTVAPAVTDTTLGNYLAYQSSDAPGGSWNPAISRGGSPDYWVMGSGTQRFNAGVATGNLTEVGFGYFNGAMTSANHRVSSRALIVDSLGAPTSITVLADEYLDVTYSMKYYPYTGADVIQTVNISGVSYTFTTRALSALSSRFVSPAYALALRCYVNTYTGPNLSTPPALSAVTDDVMTNPGATSKLPLATPQAYVDGSLSLTSVVTAGLGAGNLAYGIRGMIVPIRDEFASSGLSNTNQVTVSPAIPKDSTKVLSFGLTYSWGRYP